MGDYVTVANVQSMIQGTTFDGTSKPSSTEVELFITLIEAEMNAWFKQIGFDVPVTGTESLKIAQAVAMWGASARTLDAIYALTSVEEDERAARWWKEYHNLMKGIVETGGDPLHDAPRRTSEARVNTAPVLGRPNSEEGNMGLRDLTYHRQLYREDALGNFRSWGVEKG